MSADLLVGIVIILIVGGATYGIIRQRRSGKCCGGCSKCDCCCGCRDKTRVEIEDRD